MRFVQRLRLDWEAVENALLFASKYIASKSEKPPKSEKETLLTDMKLHATGKDWTPFFRVKTTARKRNYGVEKKAKMYITFYIRHHLQWGMPRNTFEPVHCSSTGNGAGVFCIGVNLSQNVPEQEKRRAEAHFLW